MSCGHYGGINSVDVARWRGMASVTVHFGAGRSGSFVLGESDTLDLVTSLLAAGAPEYVCVFEKWREGVRT